MGWHGALTDEALGDLERVVAFIAQQSPAAAERVGLELVALIFSLEELPSRGAPLRHRPALRRLSHRHYLVIYRVNTTNGLVEIVRVWDTRRDPDRLRLP